MRVVLAGSAVQLPGVGKESGRYNLALGYLGAYAKYHVDSLDLSLVELPVSLDRPEFPEDSVERILAGDPEIIGISSYTWDVDAFLAILPELRRRAPGVPIVLGGPTATFDAPQIMASVPEIDIAVRGEGEETLVELIRGGVRRPEGVGGLVYRAGGGIMETEPRGPIEEMASLRSPYLAGLIEPPRNNLMIECSRGCLFRCKYCAWKNFLGGVRYSAPETLRGELRWAMERGYSHAFILDSAINFETERLKGLAGLLRDTVPEGAMRFSYFLSHLHVNDEQIRALSGIAPHEIYVGLESVREQALRTVGRPKLDKVKFERVLDQISVMGPATVSIILGIPGDTLDGFKETVDYLVELAHRGGKRRIAHVRVFWMIITPGSSLAGQKAELGIVTASRGVPYLLESATFSRDDMRSAIEFLAVHPARSLFLWDDADPAGQFPGLVSLAPGDGQGDAGEGGPDLSAMRMSMEELARVLPMVRPGLRSGSGWEVLEVRAREGWPLIRMARGDERLDIQVRHGGQGVPALVSTGRYALSWMAAERGLRPSDEGAVTKLLRAFAREIRRREGGA